MHPTRSLAAAVLAVAFAGSLFVSTAGATPGVNPPAAEGPVSGTLDGSSDRPLRVSQDGVSLRLREETTVATFELTYQPGSTSGWHSHPGIVIVVVKSGTVERSTVDRAGRCTTDTFAVGDSFTEVGPHFVGNPTDEPASLSITRIYPADQTTARLDERAPRCRRS